MAPSRLASLAALEKHFSFNLGCSTCFTCIKSNRGRQRQVWRTKVPKFRRISAIVSGPQTKNHDGKLESFLDLSLHPTFVGDELNALGSRTALPCFSSRALITMDTDQSDEFMLQVYHDAVIVLAELGGSYIDHTESMFRAAEFYHPVTATTNTKFRANPRRVERIYSTERKKIFMAYRKYEKALENFPNRYDAVKATEIYRGHEDDDGAGPMKVSFETYVANETAFLACLKELEDVTRTLTKSRYSDRGRQALMQGLEGWQSMRGEKESFFAKDRDRLRKAGEDKIKSLGLWGGGEMTTPVPVFNARPSA